MLNYQIVSACDLCGAIDDAKIEKFEVGKAIKVKVPDGWKLIAIDGDDKHIQQLLCPEHKVLNLGTITPKIHEDHQDPHR